MANVNFHGYTSGGGSGAVDSVNGKTGAVILYGSNIDISSGDNTKISTALNDKADTADLATVAFTGDYEDLTGAPSLSTVAVTGDYDDLSNKPIIPIALNDMTDVTITSASNGQVLSYSSGSWVNTTLSGGGDMLASTYDPSSAVATAGGIPDYVEDKIAEVTDVTTFAVSTTGWTADTTSQSGTTLYKKSISLTHVYVESPTVDIGAGTGYVLPTAAEQAAYVLLQYVTIDGTTLYLYASGIPTTAFYINVEGVD